MTNAPPGKLADQVTESPQAFLFANLLPVTIGNVIGGALMVGVVYWFVYLRRDRRGGSEASSDAQIMS
jgi:formate/nitrite transporter FocA (FNT family)